MQLAMLRLVLAKNQGILKEPQVVKICIILNGLKLLFPIIKYFIQ